MPICIQIPIITSLTLLPISARYLPIYLARDGYQKSHLYLLAKQSGLVLGLDSCLGIGDIYGLVDADEPKEVVLDDAEVKKDVVEVPGNAADHSASNGVENEVVGGGNNDREDQGRVGQATYNDGDALPRSRADTVDGEGRDGKTNQ